MFVPSWLKHMAYVDSPLPIGSGQTISAPHMVAMMSEALDVKPGQKVLEVGTGSGYQAAVLSVLGAKHVYTVERIGSLAERARKTLHKLGYDNVSVLLQEGTLGYAREAPYDRIIVTAGAPRVPKALSGQLAENGILVIPVGDRRVQRLLLIEKKRGELIEKNLGDCVFVPLVGTDAW